MENLFTKGEIIAFKVVGLTMALIAACVPIWLFYKNKKETKELEEMLKREIIARKDSENKTAKENAERWNFLYHHEKEVKEKHCEGIIEQEKEIRDLRRQLEESGILHDKHDIITKSEINFRFQA